MTLGKPQKYHKTKVTPKGTAKFIVTGEIKRDIELLKASVLKAFEARGRFWFQAALEGAYALYVAWRDVGKSKKNAKNAARLFGVKIRMVLTP